MFRVERASVYVVDRERGGLRSSAAYHNGSSGVRLAIAAGEGPASAAAERREPVQETAASAAEVRVADPVALRGCVPRDVLAVPVIDRDGTLEGVLELVNRTAGGAFSVEDRKMLSDIAAALAEVLARCRLAP